MATKQRIAHWCFVAQGKVARKERVAAFKKAKASKGEWAQGKTRSGVKWCVFPAYYPRKGAV